MDEQSLGVESDGLRLGARDVREAAVTLAGKLDAHHPPCNHHWGWSANEALNALTSAWATHLNGHVEEGHDAVHRLHRTRTTYSTGEDVGRAAARRAMPRVEDV